MELNVVFIPLARVTFSMPDAESNFRKSCALVEGLGGNINRPSGLLTSPGMLSDFADTIVQPDLIIYQCTTFVGGDFISELTRRFDCPIIIWALREPSIDGGLLKLNSLTGAFSAGNSLYSQNRNFQFVFGNPDEPEVGKKLLLTGQALNLIKKLKTLVIGVVGSQPAGFGFGAVDEALLTGKLGIRTVQTEASAIMKKAASYTSDDFSDSLGELKSLTRGWEKLPAENLEKHARLRKAYQDFIQDNKISAVASRCWPDFFADYGAPVCSVLSLLNDDGIAASCETDMGGAISMFIGAELTGGPTYLGDPVAVDESCDGIVFWHCGAGATNLARKSEGPKVGVHPNRKIGPTMEFGLKAGLVTVLRLGKDKQGFRLFVMKGEALDEPQKFFGTSVTVRPDGGKSAEKVGQFIKDGWEPHFVVAYGNIVEELRQLCDFLKIDLWKY
jgi:L-fucose isomerase-like protein